MINLKMIRILIWRDLKENSDSSDSDVDFNVSYFMF